MTTGLVHAVEDSIKQRFSGIFDSKNAIISAMTLPKFKLKWVELQAELEITRYFCNALCNNYYILC